MPWDVKIMLKLIRYLRFREQRYTKAHTCTHKNRGSKKNRNEVALPTHLMINISHFTDHYVASIFDWYYKHAPGGKYQLSQVRSNSHLRQHSPSCDISAMYNSKHPRSLVLMQIDIHYGLEEYCGHFLWDAITHSSLNLIFIKDERQKPSMVKSLLHDTAG